MNAKNSPSSIVERVSGVPPSLIIENERQRIRNLLMEAKLLLPNDDDIRAFGSIYSRHVEDGMFRRRSVAEINQMFAGYRVLKSEKQEVLGGISLFDHGDSTELGTMWSAFRESGIGTKLVTSAADQTDARVFGLTSRARNAFLKSGFVSRGFVSENIDMEDMPAFIRSYETSKRDPEVFVLDRSTETQ